jgi:regulator of sirC expression with transglutaminase-like and TPR domain
MAKRDDLPHLLKLLDDDDEWVREEVKEAIFSIEGSILVLLKPYETSLTLRQWSALEPALKPIRRAQVLAEWPSWMQSSSPMVALEQGYNRLSWAEDGGRLPSVSQSLNQLASQFRDTYPEASIGALMRFLFEEIGFGPPEEPFFQVKYSHLGSVISEKKGLQISLAVIAVLLGHRLKLPVFGFNNPGHFMILTREGQKVCFRDPFQKGKAVSESGLSAFPADDAAMAFDQYAADPTTIFGRVLANLIHASREQNLQDDLDYYQELMSRMQMAGKRSGW